MHYQGGKHFEGKWIASVLNQVREGRPYWEPFCGACGVIRYVPGGRRIASDINQDLIEMWRALQQGWLPPSSVSEEEYQIARKSDPSPTRTFIGFGCGFGGKFFGGYARGGNYADTARRALLRKITTLGDVEFSPGSYDSFPIPKGWLIYCDPPYADTIGYAKCGRFNPEAFWDWCRLASVENTVIISSFVAPGDFESIGSKETLTTMKISVRTAVTEHLFRLRQANSTYA